MRAVLIDPFACTVTEITIERDPIGHSTLAAIYAALSHETMPVQYITAVGLGRGEALFVDEEGAVKDRYPCGGARRWFRLIPGSAGQHREQGYHESLAGKGLILGNDDEGAERSTHYRAADIAPLVMFLTAGLLPFHLVETRAPWRKDA